MLDASRSFTMCPWLVTEKNSATSSTLLRIVQTPATRPAELFGAVEAAPLAPGVLSETASASAPQFSQVPASDSLPNPLSCAFNRSLLGKVCGGCEAATVVADRALVA